MGKLKSKLLLGFGILVLIVSMLSPLLPILNGHSAAATKFNPNNANFAWYNYSTVIDQSSDQLFVDGDPTDETNMYSYKSDGAQCDSNNVTVGNGAPLHEDSYGSAILDFENFSKGDKTNARLYTVSSRPNGTGMDKCYTVDRGIKQVAKASEQNASFKYDDSYTISPNLAGTATTEAYNGTYVIVPKNDPIYDKSGIKSTLAGKIAYIYNPTGSCASYIAVNPSRPSTGMLYIYGVDNNGDCKLGYATPQGVWYTRDNPKQVSIVQYDKFKASEAKNPPADKSQPSDQKSGGGGTTDDPAGTCEGAIPVLGWIICAVTEVADNMMSAAEGMIKDLLSFSGTDYGEVSGQYNGLKTAWSSIRIISTVILVILALVMIIAQIFNFDFVSAYTIKKAIPRLVVAIILMQLSWFLCITMIEIFNVIGHGIQDLIYAPFGGDTKVNNITEILRVFYSHQGNRAVMHIAGTLGMAAVAGGVFVGIGGGFGLLAAAIGVVIAVLVAVVTLIIRKIILVLLVVIAPLGIVMWILPNTEKYGKMWWDNFIKLLIMFPLIMALLAVGRVFALLVAKSPGGSQIVNFFVILVGYFGVMFLIPKTFSMGGSIMAATSKGISLAGNRIKGGLMKSQPMENFQKSLDYNRAVKGRERMEKYQDKPGRRARLMRGVGRYQAGTFGTRGTHGKVLEAQNIEQADRDAASLADIEYRRATKEMTSFEDRMDASEAIATTGIGKSIDVNGHKITVTKAMQDKAFSEIITGKKADHARRIIDHHQSLGAAGQARAEQMKSDNAPSLIKMAPSIMKGTKAGFTGLTVGGAAEMSGADWRNMSARARDLTDKGMAMTSDERAELQTILDVTESVAKTPTVHGDMDEEKFGHMTDISGLDRNGVRTSAGGGAYTRTDKTTTTNGADPTIVDFAGRDASHPDFQAGRRYN